MSVWLCIPSKRPPAEAEPVLAKWREMGYKIMIQRDDSEADRGNLGNGLGYQAEQCIRANGDWIFWRPYRGYAEAVNFLAGYAMTEKDCDWIVAAGDDTLPDPNKRADEIALECNDHFASVLADKSPGVPIFRNSYTFGVMQPTGDPWSDRRGRIIERIAGSPWLGREWCLRANKGKGPLWPGFFHCWADETLQIVAQQLGVFWQRPDICHHHANWGRPKEGERLGHAHNMPDFLKRAYSEKPPTADKKEFDRLRDGWWKECLPLEK